MLKTSKKIAIFILSFIVIFLTVFHSYYQSAHASIGDTIGGISDTISIIDALLTNTGTVVSHERIQQFYIVKQEAIDAIIFTENEDQTITFSEESVQLLKDLFEEYLQETPEIVEVVWIPTISSDAVSANFFSTVTGYYQFRSWTDNVPLSVVSGRQYRETSQDYSYKNAISFQSIDNFVFIQNTPGTFPWSSFVPAVSYWTSIWGTESSTAGRLSRLIIYTQDGTQTDYPAITHAMALNDSATIEDASSKIWNYPAEYQLTYPFNREGVLFTTNVPPDTLLVRGCNTDAPAYVPVFKNVNSYKSWVTGQADYYQFNSGYKGGDVTINPNADYSQITDAIKDVMMQSSANGDNIEAMLSQMQAAFSKALAEISGTLGDIDDNTAASNSWLEQIYDKLCDLYDMIDLYHRGEPDLENNN
ncbi:MAG: hypothetical protein HDR15_12825 [Lachnospiraceae bacterium]|nr:hypothetical protein [Lachnospiraceae bacterium]